MWRMLGVHVFNALKCAMKIRSKAASENQRSNLQAFQSALSSGEDILVGEQVILSLISASHVQNDVYQLEQE